MTTETISKDEAYLSEDGGGFVVCDNRHQAARIIRDAEHALHGEWFPLKVYTVQRCYVRPAVEGDWVLDEYSSGVMVTTRDHPDAVKGWSVLP